MMTNTDQKFYAPWGECCSDSVLSHLQLPDVGGLSGNLHFEVVIIGGGIAGLSAAQAVAETGVQVALFDAHPRLGMGASGRNAGIMCAGINMPITYTPKDSPAADLWSATHQALLQLLQEARTPGSMLDLSPVGAVCLATSKTATSRLRRETKARQGAGMSAEMISIPDLEKLTAGFLDLSCVQGAMMLPDEGTIQPLTLLANIANQARRNGAQIYGQAQINAVEKSADGWRLRFPSGKTADCRALISATGPIKNATGRIFALSFQYDAPPQCPVWWDANPYIYYDYRPRNGFLTVSGGRYGAPGTDAVDAKYHQKMTQAARRWVPSFKSVEPSHLWAVDLNVAPDLLPTITVLAKNHLVIEGLGALGVLPGIVLGRQAAARIVTTVRANPARAPNLRN